MDAGYGGLQILQQVTLEVPTGAVYSLKLEDGFLEVISDIAKGVRVPATHKARNAGTTPYRELLVEYK